MFSLLLTTGLGLCFWPGIARVISRQGAVRLAAQVQARAASLPDEQTEQMIAQAQAYNNRLAGGMVQEEISPYQEQLNAYGEGIMGILSIPSINETLPIYHGTSSEVLAAGVGHMESTALPIGMAGTRPVLTGHRGMASRSLFTRLDEMEPGDAFFIENPKETLAYEVADIQVIDPQELDALKPVAQEDLVTLVTCTPYGINSHRLLVTGKRVPYIPAMEQDQPLKTPSIRERILGWWPWGMGFLGAGLLGVSLAARKSKKKGMRR